MAFGQSVASFQYSAAVQPKRCVLIILQIRSQYPFFGLRFAICEYSGGLRLIGSVNNAKTITFLKVNVTNCGSASNDGSVVDISGFEEALFENCRFTRIIGNKGAVRLQSAVNSSAWFHACNVNFAHFVSGGFFSTGALTGTILHSVNCTIQHHFVSNGGGVFNGAAGHLFVEDTTFLNCTNIGAEWRCCEADSKSDGSRSYFLVAPLRSGKSFFWVLV
jgi:hypothetical protein